MVSPSLVSFVSSIHVDNQQLFAGHNPLVFTLTLPGEPLCKQQCKFPDSWLCYQPDPDIVAEHYQFSLENLTPESFAPQALDLPQEHALSQWSQAIEDAMSDAITTQHHNDPERVPALKLPRSSRGRCKPMKVVYTHFSRTIPKAWAGHYTPAIDKAPMKLKKQTRQIRRIESLKQRLHKWQCQKLPPEIFNQLMDDWFAIFNSSGFSHRFLEWTHRFPELGEIDADLPEYETLHALEQFLSMT